MSSLSETTPMIDSGHLQRVCEPLVRAHWERLWRYACRLCGGDIHEASDLMGETLLDVCRFFRSYRGYGFEFWVRRILYSNRMNMLAKSVPARARTVSLEKTDANGVPVRYSDVADTALGPEQRLVSDVYSERLQSALDSLPPVFRQAVLLRDAEQMEYIEIAEALGLSVGTVRTRIHRGRKMLRASFLACEGYDSSSAQTLASAGSVK